MADDCESLFCSIGEIKIHYLTVRYRGETVEVPATDNPLETVKITVDPDPRATVRLAARIAAESVQSFVDDAFREWKHQRIDSDVLGVQPFTNARVQFQRRSFTGDPLRSIAYPDTLMGVRVGMGLRRGLFDAAFLPTASAGFGTVPFVRNLDLVELVRRLEGKLRLQGMGDALDAVRSKYHLRLSAVDVGAQLAEPFVADRLGLDRPQRYDNFALPDVWQPFASAVFRVHRPQAAEWLSNTHLGVLHGGDMKFGVAFEKRW